MTLVKNQIRVGNWLFRHRSYLPVFMFLLYFYGLNQDLSSNIFQNKYWVIFCFFISFLGQLIRILTVGKVPNGTSGRNTKNQRATVLNKTGVYSTVRHPLYLGNYLIWLGLFLLIPILWVQILFSLSYWIYYERIMIAEENFLEEKFGNDYTAWAKSTPAFLPNLAKYKKNKLKYNFKNILRREYTSLSAFMILFVILYHVNNMYVFKLYSFNKPMTIILIFILLFYIIIRTLKKKTMFFKIN